MLGYLVDPYQSSTEKNRKEKGKKRKDKDTDKSRDSTKPGSASLSSTTELEKNEIPVSSAKLTETKSKSSSRVLGSLAASGPVYVDGEKVRDYEPFFKELSEEPDSIPSPGKSPEMKEDSSALILTTSDESTTDETSFSLSEMKPTPKNKNSGFWRLINNKVTRIRDSIRTSHVLKKFHTDNVVILINKQNKMAMRVTDFDEIDCRGKPRDKHDEQMHFLVTNYGWNVISLKSMTFPMMDDKFLCVREDGMLYSNGSMKSNKSRFRLHETADNFVTFESYVQNDHHVAFDKKGDLVPPDESPEKIDCTHFRVKLVGRKEKNETRGAWEVMHM